MTYLLGTTALSSHLVENGIKARTDGIRANTRLISHHNKLGSNSRNGVLITANYGLGSSARKTNEDVRAAASLDEVTQIDGRVVGCKLGGINRLEEILDATQNLVEELPFLIAKGFPLRIAVHLVGDVENDELAGELLVEAVDVIDHLCCSC